MNAQYRNLSGPEYRVNENGIWGPWRALVSFEARDAACDAAGGVLYLDDYTVRVEQWSDPSLTPIWAPGSSWSSWPLRVAPAIAVAWDLVAERAAVIDGGSERRARNLRAALGRVVERDEDSALYAIACRVRRDDPLWRNVIAVLDQG